MISCYFGWLLCLVIVMTVLKHCFHTSSPLFTSPIGLGQFVDPVRAKATSTSFIFLCQRCVIPGT